MRINRLQLAAAKASDKVKQIPADGKSSFMDVANGLACILVGNSKRNEKTLDNKENKDFFRDYFRAINDYLHLVRNNQEYGQAERFGNIMQKPYVCALPQIKDMEDSEANARGYRDSKIAYIALSKESLGVLV